MIEHGVTYVGYDEDRIQSFMAKVRVKQLTKQLNNAQRRGFASTKVPLPLLKELLAMLS